MLSIKKLLKLVLIVICLVSAIGTTGCFYTEEERYYTDEFEGDVTVANDVISVTGKIVFTYEDIQSVGYMIYREDDNGNVDIKKDTPILIGKAEAKDGEFNGNREYCYFSFNMLNPGRYILIFIVNGNFGSEISKKIIIDKNKKIVDNLVNTDINSNSIIAQFSRIGTYSFVVYRLDGVSKNIVNTGTVSIDESKKNENILLDKGYGTGIYEVRIYNESLEEINGKFENFICINSDIKSYKFIFE